jgi:hypothetical protein
MTPIPGDEMALFERLIRIETKLDVANTYQVDHEGRIRALENENTPGGHLDHENRIRRLERSVWIAAGAAATVGGVLGQFIAPLIGG